MVGLVLAGGAVMTYGTDELKQQHLRSTLNADEVWCQLFSEPGAGSDLGSLSTRADRDGDRFIINGQKVWCSGGRCSNWGILMARTDFEAKKHEGISFFLIPMDLPGIEVRPLKQMTGESDFDEVFFTDVELPVEYLIGPLHGGWGVGMAVLTNERGHIGASIIGLERRLESLASLGKERELSPTQRQQLAALISTGTAYKSVAQTQGPVASTASSLMKLGITEMSFKVAMLRGDIAGADAMLEGADSLGLTYWQQMRLIVLPQALKIVIPPLVGLFIALFKDTSLVVIIGIFDLTQAAKAALVDQAWRGFSIEIYVFISAIYFVFCYSMSKYSQSLEKRLATEHQR
jgi:alkylation response protein AidB-like acyl-CoA dehydrogenase